MKFLIKKEDPSTIKTGEIFLWFSSDYDEAIKTFIEYICRYEQYYNFSELRITDENRNSIIPVYMTKDSSCYILNEALINESAIKEDCIPTNSLYIKLKFLINKNNMLSLTK